MEYNIVTNNKIIAEIKKYNKFQVSLGYADYVGKPEEKVLNDKDRFAFFYNSKYRTSIFGSGYIGDINFYVDHYIIQDHIVIYFNKEEYLFDFNWDKVKEKGIEWYLGSLLKDINEQIDKKQEEEVESQKLEGRTTVGNPNKLNPKSPEYSPGSVTFDDIKAYQEAKQKGLV